MSSDERPGAPADLAAATGRPAEGPEAPAEPSITETVAAQIGGVRGMVESSIPVLVFVAVNIFSDLKPALWGAVGSAVLIALFRLARRESVRHAVNGLIGVAVAALIAARTGRAEDFYLPGIVMNFLYGVAFAGSAASGGRWSATRGRCWSAAIPTGGRGHGYSARTACCRSGGRSCSSVAASLSSCSTSSPCRMRSASSGSRAPRSTP